MLNMSQSDCRNGGIAFAAGEDLSLKAGFLVKLDTGKDLVLPTSDQDITPYVVTHGADQGYLCGAVPLSSFMNCRVVLDGTCEAGTMLVAKGDGRVTAYTAGSAARVIGVAEEKGVAGQHILLRPVSIGVKGADGAAGAAGAPGAAGAAGATGAAGVAGQDAGVLVIPRSMTPDFVGYFPAVPSLIGYIIYLRYTMEGGYEWFWTYVDAVATSMQYVVVGEDVDTLTLFPMGSGSACSIPHLIPLAVTLPVSVVRSGTPVAGGYIGPARAGAESAFAVLTAGPDKTTFDGYGPGAMYIAMVSGNVMVLLDGGGVAV